MANELNSEYDKLFLERLLNHPILTAEQELHLLRQAKQGDKKAKDRLIECNARWVFTLAKYHCGQLSIFDAFQEGSIALKTAIEKFDYRKGFKFSTYATWWIRKAIREANYDTNLIRIPIPVIEMLPRYREICDQSDRQLTSDEVASRLGVTVARLADIIQAAMIKGGVWSLDYSYRHLNNRARKLEEEIEDQTAPTSIFDDFGPVFIEAIDRLKHHEQRIIRYLFVEERDVAEVAQLEKTTVTAIHRRIRIALKKLRRPLSAYAASL